MKSRILLVEDDELCQEIVAEFLTEVDAEITLATDGYRLFPPLKRSALILF